MMRKLIALLLCWPFAVWATCVLEQTSGADQYVNIVLYQDSGGANPGELHTGETLEDSEILLSKNGAALAVKEVDANCTEDGTLSGYYRCILGETDLATAGWLQVVPNNAGSLQVPTHCLVMPTQEYDSLYGTDYLQVDVIEWESETVPEATGTGIPQVDVQYIETDAQSSVDLKDFADAGYNPATDKVTGVLLTDTATTLTNKTGFTAAPTAGSIVDASLGGNLEIVFETDFSTNYNTTRDAWETNLTDTIGTLVGGEIAVGAFAANAVSDAAVANDVQVDVVTISTDSTAANNAESFFDGTGYAGTNNVIPTVTALTGHTAQTGDSFARIGATGSGLTTLSTQASVDTMDGIVDNILVDTAARDTVTERVADFGGFAGTIGTVSSLDVPLSNGPTGNDELNDEFTIVFFDVSDSSEPFCHRRITDWVGGTQTATINSACTTAALQNSTDTYIVIPNGVGSALAVVSDTTSEIQVDAEGFVQVDVQEWLQTNVNEQTAGYPSVTIKDGTGTGEINTLSGAVVNVDTVDSVTALGANAIGAGDIADDGIEAGDFATGAIDADAIATSALTTIELDYCGTGIKFTVQNNAANSTSQVCTDLTDADFIDDQFGGSSIPKRAVVFMTGNAEGLASTIQSFDTTGGACSDLLTFTDIGTEPAQDVIGCIH